MCWGGPNLCLSGNKYSSCWYRIRNSILTFCRCCLIVSIRCCIFLGRPRKRGIDFLNRNRNIKALFIFGIIPLNKEDVISFLKIMSEFLKNNADIILNISILLSCIILYINIPKVISIVLTDKENKEEIEKR